jgi:hypothetical protein
MIILYEFEITLPYPHKKMCPNGSLQEREIQVIKFIREQKG